MAAEVFYATLADMASKAPRSVTEFTEVSGIGKVKASQYGEAFVEEIIRFMDGGRG